MVALLKYRLKLMNCVSLPGYNAGIFEAVSIALAYGCAVPGEGVISNQRTVSGIERLDSAGGQGEYLFLVVIAKNVALNTNLPSNTYLNTH